MAEQKGKMSRGCLIALIVAAIIALLLIIIGIVCYVYQDEIIELGLNKLTATIASEIKTDLPPDVTAADVDSLMGEFNQAYKDKKINQYEIQELSTMFQRMLQDKKIDQEEGKEFMKEIRKVIDE